VAGVIAATGSDWNPGGSIMTFYFPIGLFAVVATTLYLMFSRPHRRIPPPQALAPARSAPSDSAAARAAAVAGGLPTAAGGGGTESPAEPAGAPLASDADSEPGQGGSQDNAGQPARETPAADRPEGSE
jgi:hypothetical protein